MVEHNGMEFRNGHWTSDTTSVIHRRIEQLARKIVAESSDRLAVERAEQILRELRKLG